MSGRRVHEGVVVEKRRWGGLNVIRKPMRRNESRVMDVTGTGVRVNIQLTGAAIVTKNWTGSELEGLAWKGTA